MVRARLGFGHLGQFDVRRVGSGDEGAHRVGRRYYAAVNAFSDLSAQLRGSAPEGLCELSDAELADLSAAVADARHRQAAALAEAGDRALSHIPRLLRGPIKRIVG